MTRGGPRRHSFIEITRSHCWVSQFLQADPEIRRVAEALAAHVSTHGFAATVAAGAQGAGLGADLELESPARKSEELFVGEVKVRGDACPVGSTALM